MSSLNLRKIRTIGRHTLISLPDLKLTDVPAKIDTGAYSSSIWASNISIIDGELQFTLFNKQSAFYSGKIINTKTYKVLSIRNSFGHTELRYKVPLRVNIEGRLMRIQFTLSNRAANRFPVLIGRRTLQSRFVVDVSQAPTVIENGKVIASDILQDKNIGSWYCLGVKAVKQLSSNLFANDLSALTAFPR
ncbi:MAG TPA: RimK/LysX family protein [Candidatus Saccharimonadales bacterium]|jgi:hypothetical protein|nr:RimK/LysX family protein [Candidatus Saccharimonadales bacterium]